MADFDIAVIGAGSGNALVGDGWPGQRVVLIDAGIPFGGTCLNRGCIPTKLLAHTSQIAQTIRQAGEFGLKTAAVQVDWPAIQQRVFGRTDAIAAGSEASRADSEEVSLLRGHAQFLDPHTLHVTLLDGSATQLTAETIIVATGARPVIPEVVGLDQPNLAGKIFTSDDIMRIEALPKSLAIMGGGTVAVEFADLFAGLGVEVTLIQRSGVVLRRADEQIAEAVTADFAQKINLRLNQRLTEVEADGDQVAIYASDANGVEYSYNAQALLLAVGRQPNTDLLGADRAGLALKPNGQLVVDQYLRTSQPHIWALGDVSAPELLKHVANHEARVVRHNLANDKHLIEAGQRPIPQAIFTNPQVAWVGATEQELRQVGQEYRVGIRYYRDVAYGWALADEGPHFVKVLADPVSGNLLGAHIYGAEACSLLQPLVQAMTFGLDAPTMARGMYWPHPGLQEVVENALLDLDITGPKKSRLPWRR